MNRIVLLFAAVALLSADSHSSNVNRHIKLLEMKNNIDVKVQRKPANRKFINLTGMVHPLKVQPIGTPLELTCDAFASPAPSVLWFKNDAPIYEFDLSNELIETNPQSMAKVVSTLLVPRTERIAEYSCLVVAGAKTARASTIVYSTGGGNEFTERSKLIPLAPRILVTYKVFVDFIGNTMVMPCRVQGHPRPKVTWRDNGGRPVGRDPRMKVLRSGELVISSLRWSDMGEYTCIATNMFGSQVAKTFMYPARADKQTTEQQSNKLNIDVPLIV